MFVDKGCVVIVSTDRENHEFVVVDVDGEKSTLTSGGAHLVEYQRIDRMVLVPKRESGEWSEI